MNIEWYGNYNSGSVVVHVEILLYSDGDRLSGWGRQHSLFVTSDSRANGTRLIRE